MFLPSSAFLRYMIFSLVEESDLGPTNAPSSSFSSFHLTMLPTDTNSQTILYHHPYLLSQHGATHWAPLLIGHWWCFREVSSSFAATDEHGLKIKKAACVWSGKEGNGKDFCDTLSERFRVCEGIVKCFFLCWDTFSRIWLRKLMLPIHASCAPLHHRAVQDIWVSLHFCFFNVAGLDSDTKL